MSILDIISDVAWQTNSGIPDFSDPNHVRILELVLRSLDLPESEVKRSIQQLREASDDNYVHKAKGVYVKQGQENNDDATKYEKTDDGKYIELEGDAESGDDNREYTKDMLTTPEEGSAAAEDGKSGEGDEADVEVGTTTADSNIIGDIAAGDNQAQHDVLQYGYSGMEEATGEKPAPGNNGSAFNEVGSGQGVRMLDANPDMTDEELIDKLINTVGQTTLGQLQSKSPGIPIPANLKEAKQVAKQSGDKAALVKANQQINTYTKCVIAAKSARVKYNTTQERISTLQGLGKFGKPQSLVTYYGAAQSITAQVAAVDNASSVLLPSGVEISRDDAKKFIKMGGRGANPSDTATFVSDDAGNLMLQFHSDKTSTSDIQGSKTVSAENKSVLARITRNDTLSPKQKQLALDAVNTHNTQIREIEEGYQDQAIGVAAGLKTLPIEDQVLAIQLESTKVGKKYLDVAVLGADGVKKQYITYIPADADPANLTDVQKYDMIRSVVADGNGTANDVKVISKVTKAIQGKLGNDTPDAINISRMLSSQRKQAVETIRDRRKALDSIEPGPPPLGVQQETEEIISGFHLGVIDDIEYNPGSDDTSRMSAIMNSSFDVNMGGVVVNKKTLRAALGVDSIAELQQKFNVEEVEDFTYADKAKTIITGKKVYTYVVNKDGGEKLKIGYKTYRSTEGATGKSRTTITYDPEFQQKLREVQ